MSGAAVGGILGSVTGTATAAVGGVDRIRARNLQARQDRMLQSLKNIYQNQLAGDPLFENIMGQAASDAGQGVFNKRKLFQDASGQINAAMRRQSGDQLQMLAGFGFDQNSEQGRFLQGRLQRAKVRQLGSVQQMLEQAQMQSAQLQQQSVGQQAASTDLFTGLQSQVV